MKNKNADINKHLMEEIIGIFVTCDNRRSPVEYSYPQLNNRIKYQLYQGDCVFKKRIILSECVFRCFMEKHFELDFVRHTKTSCNVCDLNKNDQENLAPNQLNQMIDRATQKNDRPTIVSDNKNNFVKSVKHVPEAKKKEVVATFEMQHANDLPHIDAADTNDMLHKKQLWFHRSCAHDEVRQMAHLYAWDESIASNGSQVTASCLYKHIEQYIPGD